MRLTAALCSQVASKAGLTPRDTAERLSHLFLTGWPHHRGTPWINLQVARFFWRVDRCLSGAIAQPSRRVRSRSHIRVGLLANLGSTLTFAPAFFRQCPENVDLSVFDLGGRDRAAGYLDRLTASYESLQPEDTGAVARSIERADLDVLLFDVYKADLDTILDRITVPCTIDVCTTVKLRFHPRVSFHLYCLQQADYLIRTNHLFSATSESFFHDRITFPSALLFDKRDLDPYARLHWRDRDPLLVYHGKLYKLSDSYLDAVLQLLADDSALQLVMMGRDDNDSQLTRIGAAAARLGVSDQLNYEGEFRVVRNNSGEVDNPSWLRLRDLLSRARLAPDPWPLAGAYSRVEAYAAGTPVVHMGIRTDTTSWRERQLAVTADHPALSIEQATAYTVDDYLGLARRLLYDETFANAVSEEQAERALRLTDGSIFWKQISSRYLEWLEVTGRTDASNDLGFKTESSTPSHSSH